MHLRCSRGMECSQTCKAQTECDMECFGCKQSCEATSCRMTKTWPSSSPDKVICSGNSKCCESLITTYDTPSLMMITFTTKCGNSESCTCTKYSKSLYSTSNLNTSNIVTSTKVKTIQVFASKISVGQESETYSEYNKYTKCKEHTPTFLFCEKVHKIL